MQISRMCGSLLAGLACVGVLNVVGCASTGGPVEPEAVSLFDGETLAGWHVMQKPEGDNYYSTEANFVVKDGAVHCLQSPEKTGGLLLTDAQYSDFELTLETKNDWGCDSGIFLRCTQDGRGIQILNDYLEDGCVAFVYGQGTGQYLSRPIRLFMEDGDVVAKDEYDALEVDKLVYAINAEGFNAAWNHGEWNTIKICCEGDEPLITTWVNGTKVMAFDGRVYQGRELMDEINGKLGVPTAWDRDKVNQITGGKGSIGLQIHPGDRWKVGGAAMYRNIRITDLSADE